MRFTPGHFEAIVAEVSLPLRRYLRRYSGDPQTAEDLLQETLLRMARGLPEFSGRSSLKTWAFSIATNVAADYYRQPAHRLRIVEIADTDTLVAEEQPLEDRAETGEMIDCIREVIDSLPEDYRSALVLHDIELLSLEQTAAACACSLATAKIRVHRARKRLRETLGTRCDFYRDKQSNFCCCRKPDEPDKASGEKA